MKFACVCLCILIYFLAVTLAELENPYKILGLTRSATANDIRSQYKKLVKKWHPDKSSNPEAENTFISIKQAYELLIDPERRKKYDQLGIVEDVPRPNKFDYSNYHHYPFDDFFGDINFNFQDNDITFFHRLSISTKQYDKVLVPKSVRKPHFILFYNDWCFPCLQAAPYFRKLVEYLEPLGVEFATVHSSREPNLARRLNIHGLPCLILLLDGNTYVYKAPITSVQKIVDFFKTRLPYKLIATVRNENFEEFLNGWEDNKVRGLIFEPRTNVRLRYLITAYYYRDRVAFGFVNSSDIWKQYRISSEMDTVLLFNENNSKPVASISMKEIPTQTLNHIISSNQYLALPRLSSQGILDALCPCEWNKPRKRLCVVLVTSAASCHDAHRQSFRKYVQGVTYNLDRVRFAYIYHDKQSEFINSLVPEGDPVEPLLRIVIIWRRDTSHVKYEWLTEKWEIEADLNETTEKLEKTISRLLRSSEALSYEAFVKDLFDEHSKGIFGRLISKLIIYTESFIDGLGKEQILPALSIFGTIIFIVAIGYLMAYLVRLEEESVRKQSDQNGNAADKYQPELRLHELRAENYNGLVRLLKPGCRTIVLILDGQSRQHLVPPFHKAVWPYRKNKTLYFCYMYIERGLSWYKELLEASLCDDRELNINPRNCVGTVLALNGLRKYFCMFHAKHLELNKKKKTSTKSKKENEDPDCEAAAFIGFDSSSSESEDVLLEGTLLNGLSNWLDRLFEGTTQRYHINYWPEFPNK